MLAIGQSIDNKVFYVIHVELTTICSRFQSDFEHFFEAADELLGHRLNCCGGVELLHAADGAPSLAF